MALTLIGGGARSGKSRYALELAKQHAGRLAFVATAEALDDEMRERIRSHQAERSSAFSTIEAPLDLAIAFDQPYDLFVVDCLTLWCSNMLFAGRDIAAETARMLEAARAHDVILVTNEVGCGIVPENELARRFRDEAGRMNQRCAEAADTVYWMVFGVPLKVK
ncbi:MAG: bifunctional adenosylcobinamide kinase/adenosylcobinamide-phosphate guanylyltransferase [Bryobacteraceae bacterium]